MILKYLKEPGAENETRTRDPDLGKVVLYQLSYFRKILFQNFAASCHDSAKPNSLSLLSLLQEVRLEPQNNLLLVLTVQKYNFFKYENKKNEKFFPNYNRLIINYYKVSTPHFSTALSPKR